MQKAKTNIIGTLVVLTFIVNILIYNAPTYYAAAEIDYNEQTYSHINDVGNSFNYMLMSIIMFFLYPRKDLVKELLRVYMFINIYSVCKELVYPIENISLQEMLFSIACVVYLLVNELYLSLKKAFAE